MNGWSACFAGMRSRFNTQHCWEWCGQKNLKSNNSNNQNKIKNITSLARTSSMREHVLCKHKTLSSRSSIYPLSPKKLILKVWTTWPVLKELDACSLPPPLTPTGRPFLTSDME